MLDANRKVIQGINSTANLNLRGKTKMFYIMEEAKETVLDFPKRTVRVE